MSHERSQTTEEQALSGHEHDRPTRPRGARIAVVDNDPTLLSLLTMLLEDRGWKSIPSDEARLAWKLIRNQLPDLVLLDLWLDTPTAGWDLLSMLKRDPATRDIPVIVCSGAIDHLARRKAGLAEHAVAVVTKPFDVDDLCDTVESVLAGRRAKEASLRSA